MADPTTVDGRPIEGGSAKPVAVMNPLSVSLTGTIPGTVEIANDSGNPVPVSVAVLPASLGQKTMAASLPVVIASDQSPVKVSANVSSAVNTPAIVTSGGDAIAANAARKAWAIQNLGTNPLFVRLATGASTTVFHVILKGSAAQDDGSGGYFSDDIHLGVVSATGTSPRFVVTELT